MCPSRRHSNGQLRLQTPALEVSFPVDINNVYKLSVPAHDAAGSEQHAFVTKIDAVEESLRSQLDQQRAAWGMQAAPTFKSAITQPNLEYPPTIKVCALISSMRALLNIVHHHITATATPWLAFLGACCGLVVLSVNLRNAWKPTAQPACDCYCPACPSVRCPGFDPWAVMAEAIRATGPALPPAVMPEAAP